MKHWQQQQQQVKHQCSLDQVCLHLHKEACIHVLRYPHKSAEDQYTINIKSSVGGLYEFPENFHLVSPVLWLHGEPPQLTIPLTMTIEHCAKQENIHRLSFATASILQKSLPYTFKQAGGNFISTASNVEITLESFSGSMGFAVIQEGTGDRKYTAISFYQRQTYSTYEIHLVVTWSTKAHLCVSGTCKFSILSCILNFCSMCTYVQNL